jgi:hypothetical protein
MTPEPKWLVPSVSVLSGLVIFWIALHCKGGDWFISETHADVIYSGLRRFREFPFFSFTLNGGAYLLQDPQSNLFSPAVPLIWLAGPSIGLRLAEGLSAGLGVYVYVVWLRRHVGTYAALIAAVASVTGLGVLWKVAVGNDMFLWHLGLPALLWAAESVISKRDWDSVLSLGLVLGGLLMGPTFHSFIYLFGPALPLFVVLSVIVARPSARELGRLAGLLAAAGALALLIASPKLVSWSKFSMSRPVMDMGVLSWRDTLMSAFDYSWVEPWLFETTYIEDDGLPRVGVWWGVEECAVALTPLASVLALAGGVVALRTRARRPLAAFGLVLVASGVALACSWPIWSSFRGLAGGNIRVAPRFLGMTAFGLSVLAALGAQALLERVSRVGLAATLAVVGMTLASALWWTHAAGRSPTIVTAHPATVAASAVNPLAVWRDERARAARLSSFTELAAFTQERRTLLDGIGYKDGFFIVGNELKPKLWMTRDRAARKLNEPDPVVVSGIQPDKVRMTHLTISVRDLPAHASVRLRALIPRFGVTTTADPGAVVSSREEDSLLVITNQGDRKLGRVKLRANMPISRLWFGLSGVVVLLSFFGLSRRAWLEPHGG